MCKTKWSEVWTKWSEVFWGIFIFCYIFGFCIKYFVHAKHPHTTLCIIDSADARAQTDGCIIAMLMPDKGHSQASEARIQIFATFPSR